MGRACGVRLGYATYLRTGPIGRAPWIWATLAAAGCASGPSSAPEEIGATGTGLTSVAVGQLSSRQSTVEVRNEASVAESAVAAPLRTVWGVMPGVFQRLQVEMSYVDAGAGTIGNGNFRPRRLGGRSLSTFLDCGSGLTGPYADAYAVRMSLLVQLLPAADGATTVRTSIDAYAEDRAVNARPIHCNSRGTLERQIWSMIDELVKA
ncbi:MAG: hypothetical protein AB7T31_12785 [Gemmatimonadales bacterium]